MKSFNENKVDDVYLSPYDRWLYGSANQTGEQNKEKMKKKIESKA